MCTDSANTLLADDNYSVKMFNSVVSVGIPMIRSK